MIATSTAKINVRSSLTSTTSAPATTKPQTSWLTILLRALSAFAV